MAIIIRKASEQQQKQPQAYKAEKPVVSNNLPKSKTPSTSSNNHGQPERYYLKGYQLEKIVHLNPETNEIVDEYYIKHGKRKIFVAFASIATIEELEGKKGDGIALTNAVYVVTKNSTKHCICLTNYNVPPEVVECLPELSAAAGKEGE